MTRTLFAAPVALAIASVLVASGCSAGDAGEVTTADARAVTAEESQALAMTRVRNLEAGARSVAFGLLDEGTDLVFDGWFDYASGAGYGLLTSDDGNNLILWNHDGLAVAPWSEDTAPLPVPRADSADAKWSSGPLDPAGSRLHSVLGVVAALGSDRPDNPLLVRGSGALWLAGRSLGDTDVLVISGPPSDEALAPGQSADPEAASIRYWIEDNGLAHRVDIRVGGGGDWVAVSFGPAEGITIQNPVNQSDNSL